MNISEAAKRTGLPAKTLRYYEEIALVTPSRSDNAYREYNETHLHQLRFVKRARGLGFSVRDCGALLELYANRERSSADVKAIASARIADIDRKLEELTAMRRVLGHLVERCEGNARPDCPILDDLADSP